jgi:hypothetical protein
MAWSGVRSPCAIPGRDSSSCKIANWQTTPQEIAFPVLSTGGSSWAISVTYEDSSGVYPSPVSSSPTAFTLLAGSSNQVAAIGSSLGNYFSSNCPTA